jgi:hypothetical protein
MFINSTDSAKQEHYFKRSSLAAIKMSVFLGAFMNLFVYSLPVELILQPLLVFLILMQVVSGTKEELLPVKKMLDLLVSGAFVTVALYEVSSLVKHHSDLTHSDFVGNALMPVWLALGLLPFIFLVGVVAQYELAFIETEMNSGRKLGKRLALFTSFGLRSHKLHEFVSSSAHCLFLATSFSESRSSIRTAGGGESNGDDETNLTD